jgi:uncharacterized protein YcfJ
METSSLNRIHPLMAAAAVSVIVVSLTGAAAITGLLPNSNSAPDPQLAALVPAASPDALPAKPASAPGMAPLAAPLSAPTAAYMPATAPAAAYAPAAPVVKEEKPVVKRSVEKPRVVHQRQQTTQVARNDAPRSYDQRQQTTQVARNDAPRSYEQQPVQPTAAQPNYVGIGAGAVIGGLIGNQIGGGNGKKLATVAGIIGGGMLGNEIANRSR